MKVVVYVGSWAQRYVEQPIVEVLLAEGSTISDLLHLLPIPSTEIGAILVGGLIVSHDYVLHKADTICIYPSLVDG